MKCQELAILCRVLRRTSKYNTRRQTAIMMDDDDDDGFGVVSSALTVLRAMPRAASRPGRTGAKGELFERGGSCCHPSWRVAAILSVACLLSLPEAMFRCSHSRGGGWLSTISKAQCGTRARSSAAAARLSPNCDGRNNARHR